MKNILMVVVIIALLTLLLVPKANQGIKIEVLRIIDGDTITAKIADNEFKIRLIDIDCYESQINPRAKWQAEKYNTTIEDIIAGGGLAGDVLKQELSKKQVTFDFRGIDKYHRALGYIYANNKNINKKMLKMPYCKPYEKMPKQYQQEEQTQNQEQN